MLHADLIRELSARLENREHSQSDIHLAAKLLAIMAGQTARVEAAIEESLRPK